MSTSGIIEGLKALRIEADHIAGEWNGDEPGAQEDNANAALDLIDNIDEILALIEELGL